MSWLFVPRRRPSLWPAAAVGLVLNLALPVPALHMVQVFDRVFASRSSETLAMLTVLAALALCLSYFMDALRGRAQPEP